NGTPALGIVLRAQLSGTTRYRCLWVAKDRQLHLQAQNGGNTTTLASAAIAPNATIPTTFTMEAAVDGTMLGCCIRELDDARLMNVSDQGTGLTGGFPGLETNRLAAAFGSFVVFGRP